MYMDDIFVRWLITNRMKLEMCEWRTVNRIDWETDKYISYKDLEHDEDAGLSPRVMHQVERQRERKTEKNGGKDVGQSYFDELQLLPKSRPKPQKVLFLQAILNTDDRTQLLSHALRLYTWCGQVIRITSETPRVLASRVSRLFAVCPFSDMGGVDRRTVVWSSTNVWNTSDVNVTAQSFLRWTSFASLTISHEASS